jgi:hypothetical protein
MGACGSGGWGGGGARRDVGRCVVVRWRIACGGWTGWLRGGREAVVGGCHLVGLLLVHMPALEGLWEEGKLGQVDSLSETIVRKCGLEARAWALSIVLSEEMAGGLELV